MATDFLDRWLRSKDLGNRNIDDGPRTRRESSDNQTRRTAPAGDVPATADSREGDGADKPADTSGSLQERINKRIYAANYRNRHKDKINAQRRLLEQEPMGAYKKARRKAKYKKIPWELSYENWWNVWASCPRVFDEERGCRRTAWSMRSGDIQRGTQMRRIDPDRGWIVSNVQIVYRNQPVPEHGVVAPWDFREDRPQYKVNEDGTIERDI